MKKKRTIGRNTTTGKFAGKQEIKDNPAGTVTESVRTLELIRIYPDGRAQSSEIKLGEAVKLYGDEVEIKVRSGS